MSTRNQLPLLAGAPKAGEVYRHYKGDQYKVLGLAIDSTDQWVVVYEALYENPAAPMFVRPASEWHETVEWQGQKNRAIYENLRTARGAFSFVLSFWQEF